MVERPLRMREVPGSIPGFCKTKSFNLATICGNNFLLFSFPFSHFVCSVARHPALNRCIAFTLYSTDTATKVLVVHSLSPAAEEGKDVC